MGAIATVRVGMFTMLLTGNELVGMELFVKQNSAEPDPGIIKRKAQGGHKPKPHNI